MKTAADSWQLCRTCPDACQTGRRTKKPCAQSRTRFQPGLKKPREWGARYRSRLPISPARPERTRLPIDLVPGLFIETYGERLEPGFPPERSFWVSRKGAHYDVNA